MEEHREHPRAPIELRVDYRKLNSFFADYTRNISKGGTFIKTQRTLPVGTRFLFKLSIPGRAEPFALSGEVVHARAQAQAQDDAEAAGMGIRFVWQAEEDRLAFEQAVEALMAESLGPEVAQGLLRNKGG